MGTMLPHHPRPVTAAVPDLQVSIWESSLPLPSVFKCSDSQQVPLRNLPSQGLQTLEGGVPQISPTAMSFVSMNYSKSSSYQLSLWLSLIQKLVSHGMSVWGRARGVNSDRRTSANQTVGFSPFMRHDCICNRLRKLPNYGARARVTW
jgi:hypothetical protein